MKRQEKSLRRSDKPPQGWNGSIFSLIQNLSNSVIVPIAGVIITFVLCYELITMLTEKNNMHEIDTWMFFKYFFQDVGGSLSCQQYLHDCDGSL